MVIELLGIVQDGSRRSPAVPRVIRKQLDVIRGTDFTVRLKLRYPSNRPVSLESGTPVTTLYVRSHPDDEDDDALLTVVATAATPRDEGVTVFTFAAADLEDFQLGRYLYDIRHSQSSALEAVVPASPFVVGV